MKKVYFKYSVSAPFLAGLILMSGFSMGADAQAAPNLIANPGVETASSNVSLPQGWSKGGYGTNTRTLSYPVAGNTSTKAIRAEITSYTNGDAKWFFQTVPVIGGQQYTFSDFYRSNTPSFVTVQYQLQNGTFVFPDLATNLPASSNWTQVTRTFTVPTNYASPVVNITIFHLIKSVGWVETDNYSLDSGISPSPTPTPTATPSPTPTPTPTSTPTPTPAPGNPIINPSVETASASSPNIPLGWNKGGWGTNNRSYTYPVAGYNSPKAVRTEITSYTDGDTKWFFDSVPAASADQFTFSDFYRSNTASIVGVRYQLQDGTYKYPDIALNVPASSGWTQFTNTFTVPTYSSPVIQMTLFHMITSVGWLETDNYVLTKLPSTKFTQGMISLNFDDGPLTVYQNAIPILNAAGMKSTQYIITGTMNSGSPYYVTQQQVLNMAAQGHEIGAHTRTHPHLTTLTQQQMTDEIAGSKSDLQAIGLHPTTFAYPSGI